jgi:hypothetical protein
MSKRSAAPRESKIVRARIPAVRGKKIAEIALTPDEIIALAVASLADMSLPNVIF